MRIAVVEDNLSLAKAIAYRLRDRGHAVDVMHNGADADAYLANEGADLVVLDINLPGASGLDVLRVEPLTFGVAHLYVATPRTEVSDHG